MISHPFMSPTQPRDPPRHPPMVHDDTFIEPDPPQQPVATTSMPKPLAATLVDVDMPRHALV